MFPLSWTSKRQTAVARSLTEAELAAANEGVFQDGIPIKIILEKITKEQFEATLLEDDTACISRQDTRRSSGLCQGRIEFLSLP